MRWTLILSATVGAVSMYLLLRRCLGASVEAATLGFALFQLNGFILFRMAVGHLTFHIFGLAPLIACLVLWPPTNRRRELGTLAAAALCIAAIVFAGGVALILPILLGVVVVIAVAAIRTGMLTAGAEAPWCRDALVDTDRSDQAGARVAPRRTISADDRRRACSDLSRVSRAACAIAVPARDAATVHQYRCGPHRVEPA